METITPSPAPSPTPAQTADRTLRTYFASATERVFESGRLLVEIQGEELYRELGFTSFEDYLESLRARNGVARSTAYSNMRIAQVFDQGRHGHIGIGRLRKLVAVPDALAIIENGIEVPDGAGGLVRKPVTAVKCRDLAKALKRHTGHADLVPPEVPGNELAEAIHLLLPEGVEPPVEQAAEIVQAVDEGPIGDGPLTSAVEPLVSVVTLATVVETSVAPAMQRASRVPKRELGGSAPPNGPRLFATDNEGRGSKRRRPTFDPTWFPPDED